MTDHHGITSALDEAARERLVLPLLLEYAGHGVSFVSLHADVRFYVGQQVRGFVPCVAGRSLLLGLGEPLCPPSQQVRLAREFSEEARGRGLTPGFFPVGEGFLSQLIGLEYSGLSAAVEPVVLAEGFPAGATRRRLRNAARKARQAGVKCRMSFGVEIDDEQRQALGRIESRWSEHMGPLGELLLAPSPFVAAARKRYVVAICGGQPCAFASLVPVVLSNGWMVDGLFRLPDAPRGTTELLLTYLIEQFRDEGFERISLGPSMLAVDRRTWADAVVSPEDLDVANAVFRWLYAHAPALLNYRSAHKFKQKFQPASAVDCFFAFGTGRPDPGLLLDFLSVIFRGFDFKGLVHELWGRLSSQPTAGTLLPEEEEDLS